MISDVSTRATGARATRLMSRQPELSTRLPRLLMGRLGRATLINGRLLSKRGSSKEAENRNNAGQHERFRGSFKPPVFHCRWFSK